jgi:hypothetical protein
VVQAALRSADSLIVAHVLEALLFEHATACELTWRLVGVTRIARAVRTRCLIDPAILMWACEVAWSIYDVVLFARPSGTHNIDRPAVYRWTQGMALWIEDALLIVHH